MILTDKEKSCQRWKVCGYVINSKARNKERWLAKQRAFASLTSFTQGIAATVGRLFIQCSFRTKQGVYFRIFSIPKGLLLLFSYTWKPVMALLIWNTSIMHPSERWVGGWVRVLQPGFRTGPCAKSGGPPISISQVLLSNSHAHSFPQCLWLFWGYNGRVE